MLQYVRKHSDVGDVRDVLEIVNRQRYLNVLHLRGYFGQLDCFVYRKVVDGVNWEVAMVSFFGEWETLKLNYGS